MWTVHLVPQNLQQAGAIHSGESITLKRAWELLNLHLLDNQIIVICERFCQLGALRVRPWGWHWGDWHTQTGGKRRSEVRWSLDPGEVGSAQPACGTTRSPRGGTPLRNHRSGGSVRFRSRRWHKRQLNVFITQMQLTWNGLLLEQTEVQESAYSVRGSRRQEEFDYLLAVFGDKVITSLFVALRYKTADVFHELHQSILQRHNERMVASTRCDVK